MAERDAHAYHGVAVVAAHQVDDDVPLLGAQPLLLRRAGLVVKSETGGRASSTASTAARMPPLAVLIDLGSQTKLCELPGGR